MRLRPSPQFNEQFNYVVAKVAADHRVRLCAMCVMGNHWHAVVGAEERNLPDFLRDVHSELARVINSSNGDFGSIWDESDDNYDLIEDDAGVLRSIAYTMGNVVANGGVRFARNWPGVRVAWPAKDRTFDRARPFYRTEKEGGKAPAKVVRRLERPFGFVGVSDEELARRIAEACERVEKRAAEDVITKGGSFRKRSEILRMSRYSRATSWENHFEIRRRIKTTDPEKRAELLERKRKWDASYADALERWVAGDRNVVFPYGTYKMVVLHGAAMASPP